MLIFSNSTNMDTLRGFMLVGCFLLGPVETDNAKKT